MKVSLESDSAPDEILATNCTAHNPFDETDNCTRPVPDDEEPPELLQWI